MTIGAVGTITVMKAVVANALTLIVNNKAVCRILNMSPYEVTLKRGLKIAKVLNKRHSVSATGEGHRSY